MDTPGAAQPAGPAAMAFMRPSIQAVRIDPREAPVIDGDLSDPVWARAAVIDRFIQKQPVPFSEPTERTVLRILYDADNLYFGVYNYDATPEAIVARSMQRDGPQFTADSIVIQLDPGLTRRNAYSFEVGASGGRVDELVLNNISNLSEWNAIWAGRARRVPDGWVAEIAIPFRSLSYESAQTTWGFEFRRRIRHKNEQIYWSSTNPALPFTDVSESGDLVGITDINRGLGLDIQVYGALKAKHDFELEGDGAGLAFTAGGNAFYKITPALTNTFTVHPDFSDAPLDIRQVNTTRFSLFIPETRAFFLQDAASFEFGGLNFSRGFQRAFNNGRPFFSRNIGLAQGAPVSLIVGDKISGQFAGFEIGALSVLTDPAPTSADRCPAPLRPLFAVDDCEILSVVRMTRLVMGESKLGFIVTNGDPTGITENTVAGIDFQYRNSNFLGRYILQSDLFYQASFSSAAGTDDSKGITVNFPNEPWGGDFTFKEVGRNFQPKLGFVNRSAIRQYVGNAFHRRRYRDSVLNQFELGIDYDLVTDLGDRLESRAAGPYARLESRSGDRLTVSITNSFEDVPFRFFLPRDVPVLAGKYSWTNAGVNIRTFDGRALAAEIEATCCSFYGGDAVMSRMRLLYRPNIYFELIPTWEANFIRLPTGDVDIHILSLDSIVSFMPDMQLALQAQFDNISRRFGLSLRYAWEYQPGNEIFVGIGQNALIPGTTFKPGVSQLAIRLGHTFRF